MEIGWGIATVWMGLALLASFISIRFNLRWSQQSCSGLHRDSYAGFLLDSRPMSVSLG